MKWCNCVSCVKICFQVAAGFCLEWCACARVCVVCFVIISCCWIVFFCVLRLFLTVGNDLLWRCGGVVGCSVPPGSLISSSSSSVSWCRLLFALFLTVVMAFDGVGW